MIGAIRKMFSMPTGNMGTEAVNASFTPEQQVMFNEAMQIMESRINSLTGDVRGRLAAAISGGYEFSDTLHNVFLDYGYPQTVTFYMLWNMYRRFGIARNGADLPVDIGWMTPPEVGGDEASDEFKNAFNDLVVKTEFWQRLKGLDKRQRVGRYAGMFMRVRDDRPPHEPIDKTKITGVDSIMQMIPLYEGQLEVTTTEQDPRKENYSQPTMYMFKGNGIGDRNEKSGANFNIHPDRIVIAAEDADNGGIYGIPALEAPYNSLMDLRKIIGAGGEGFYKNAAQSVLFDLKDASSAASNEALLNKWNEQYDEFSRNRMRRGMWTPGMEANTLDSNLKSPEWHFKNALNDAAAGFQIPATILIGQQTGRLASSEDARGFLSGLNSRNANYTTSIVRAHIDWCMFWGVLPVSEYEVTWDDLLALSDQERLENAFKMAESNAKQFDAGGERVFTSIEIRDAAGYEELDNPMATNAKTVSETRKNNADALESVTKAAQNLVMGGEEIISGEDFRKAIESLTDEQLMGLIIQVGDDVTDGDPDGTQLELVEDEE